MSNLLSHCIFALSIQFLINYMLGLDLMNFFSLLAAIVAMAVDIDEDIDERFSSGKIAHSVDALILSTMLAGFLAFAIGLCLETAFHTTLLTILAFSVGYASHLFLDALAQENIYVTSILASGKRIHFLSRKNHSTAVVLASILLMMVLLILIPP